LFDIEFPPMLFIHPLKEVVKNVDIQIHVKLRLPTEDINSMVRVESLNRARGTGGNND